MSYPTAAPLDGWTLAELLARLDSQSAVAGVLLLGSTGGPALGPASDYDLLVLLAAPPPVHLVTTRLEGRLAEIYFLPAAALRALLDAPAPSVPAYGFEATLVGWLRTGRIVGDREGLLHTAQRRAHAERWVQPAPERAAYDAWYKINYNIQQNRRMLAAADPAYHVTVDIRMLYMLYDLWDGYFVARGLPSMGEKERVRYLGAHDPAFLAAFQRCLAEPDRTERSRAYAALARLALAPVGALWPDAATAVAPAEGAPATPAAIADALAWWADLLGRA